MTDLDKLFLFLRRHITETRKDNNCVATCCSSDVAPAYNFNNSARQSVDIYHMTLTLNPLTVNM